MMADQLFIQQKYLILRNIIPTFFCDIVVNYAKFQAFYDFTPEVSATAQVAGTHSRYADFLMEALLIHLKPFIEEAIDQSLLPTYSYYRVYKQGDQLTPHVDREACEVSATVAFGWPQSETWPFKLANDQHYMHGTLACHTPASAAATITVHLNPGDVLIYQGPTVKHWRDPLTAAAYVQAFFHYVYANGTNTAHQFDGRDAIGVPKLSTSLEYFAHSDWMQHLLQYYSMRKIEPPE